MRRAGLAVLVLIALGAIGAACGDSNGTDPNSTANFEQLRTSLRDRLDRVGANIGFVPDDVLEEMLNTCHELERFVNEDRINCDAIRRARDTSDPGLVDQIVVQLEQLTRD